MLFHALLTASLFASPVPQDSLIRADSAFRLMKQGGYTMIWRHAETDWLTQDAPGSSDRALQRNLTERGASDARAIGEMFKHARIPVGDVVASPMWRTRETAEFAFGRARIDTALRSLDRAPARAIIAVKPAKGTNRVLVTHHFIIEQNVPGVRPGMVGEGEAVVVHPNADGSVKLVSIVKLADWEKATHGTVVAARTTRAPGGASGDTTPSRPVLHGAFQLLKGGMASLRLLHDEKYFNVMRYLEAYNSGEDAMRAFFEKRAVANPERTIDQRMEAYRQLRAQLGPLQLDGAELKDEDFILQTKRTAAKDEYVLLTFRFEKAEPYKLVSLAFSRAN
jgi:hypothetical protein